MLELSTPSLSVIRCCAQSGTIDGLSEAHESLARLAHDEALLLVEASRAGRLLVDIAADVEASDPTAIVIDHSDAFAVTTLRGSFREAIPRLSAVQLPSTGFFQGLVAGVPCKVFVEPHHLHLLAPSTYADHIHERLVSACADLDVREQSRAEPESVEPMTIA